MQKSKGSIPTLYDEIRFCSDTTRKPGFGWINIQVASSMEITGRKICKDYLRKSQRKGGSQNDINR
jgi:hypothetical protein